MDSILDALQDGRLIELPDDEKYDSLQLLSHIIEAVPSVPANTDVEGLVMTREKNTVTVLGKGFACPHARVQYDEDLICAVGWSQNGINYASGDTEKVHIVIMYLVPNNQRNQYLKEISLLAKAIQTSENKVKLIRDIKDLNSARNFLLDLVASAKEIAGSDTRARMIQLETMEQVVTDKIKNLSELLIEPVTIAVGRENSKIILTQNKEILDIFDNSPKLIENLSLKGFYEINGWRIIRKNISQFQENNCLFECIAVKINV